MEVKSESEVAQSCPTLSDPMDRSLPGSSTHGISQARVLEWIAISFSDSIIGTILYGCFSLAAFRHFSLFLTFAILIMICLDVCGPVCVNLV